MLGQEQRGFPFLDQSGRNWFLFCSLEVFIFQVLWQQSTSKQPAARQMFQKWMVCTVSDFRWYLVHHKVTSNNWNKGRKLLDERGWVFVSFDTEQCLYFVRSDFRGFSWSDFRSWTTAEYKKTAVCLKNIDLIEEREEVLSKVFCFPFAFGILRALFME